MKNTDPLFRPERYRRRRAYDNLGNQWFGYLLLLTIGWMFGLLVGIGIGLSANDDEEDCVPRSEIRRIEIPGVEQ